MNAKPQTDPTLRHFEALFGPEFGHGRALETARIARALQKLGDPQDHLPPSFHVAGTNGKGSTIAFMRAIAEAAGKRVHVFTKPHLHHLRERFIIAGAQADNSALIAAAEEIDATGESLTQFEAQAAAAFLLFARAPSDIAFIETGMGGLNDATNLIAHPAAALITPIALDHQDALGATLTDIARHKSGIIKPNTPLILARQPDDVRELIEREAECLGARLHRKGVEWDCYLSNGRMVVQSETRALDLPPPALHGAHQIDNAGLAIAALLAAAPFEIPDDAFARGVSAVHWPGRLQPLTRGPLAAPILAIGGEIWLDGGHNAHAAEALRRWAQSMTSKRDAPLVLIIAMRARKDWQAFVQTLAPAAARVIALQINAEGAAAEELAQVARTAGAEAETAATLADAINKAARPIQEQAAPRILICGSLQLAAEALA